jgi:hypothetical protein
MTLEDAVKFVRSVRALTIKPSSVVVAHAREVDAELMRATGKNADQLIYKGSREK